MFATLRDGGWLTTNRVRAVALISGLAGIVMLLVLLLGGHGTVDPFGRPIGSDFTAFWNAGRLANDGHAASAYDPVILNSAVRAAHGIDYTMVWIYPPTFLLIASPLARLPYLPALLIWQGSSLLAIALVLIAILKDRRALIVALASPLTPLVLAGGQNALLSAALLGWGLLLVDRRPFSGGSLLGVLTYKPQLGLGIAPMLVLNRNWRAIAAALTASLFLALLSAFLWGPAAWRAFPGGLANGRTFMEQGTSGFDKSASLFSFARLWAAPIGVAYVLQGAGLIAALFLVWRAARAEPFIRNAAVCAAIALATPYLMDYDMATVGLGAAFLYAAGSGDGYRPYERTALAFIWMAPWITRATAHFLLLPLGPPAMILLAAMVLSRVTASPSRRSHAAFAR